MTKLRTPLIPSSGSSSGRTPRAGYIIEIKGHQPEALVKAEQLLPGRTSPLRLRRSHYAPSIVAR